MNGERYADVRKHLPFLAGREGLADLVERALGITEIRRIFAASAHEENPFAGVARRLNLKIELDGLEGKVPKNGPVVFVANHAFGGADALALTATMRKCRDDMRMLANEEVNLLGGIKEWMIPVSLLQEGSAAGQNTKSLRVMLKHVRDGGCLGVFPAGRVAFWQKGGHREPEWNQHVVKLLQRMEATIVPIWFYGAPSPLNRILSMISPFVRTALITKGLAEMRNSTISGRVGEVFSSKDLKAAGEHGAEWLRRKLETLRESGN
ncbi:1-acyl-sn-glycerol-3-phosphate acyltransferase [Akkermansiaceae bacterium]|nr:1-acyl-sn-glycerol-3-phosphate acyltransferase [Akkermansiaceae bacterium]